MPEVKWIKITTDIFDDEKILLIESLPDSYAIITVWFKLLCFAGKQNNSGVFMMNNRIAYTDKMLSTIFRMKESIVQMSLKVFDEFGMIEMVDGVITIPNWGKHQSLDKMEDRKEYMKNYMQEYREKQKALTDVNTCKVYGKANVNSLEEEVDKEVDKDIDKEIKPNGTRHKFGEYGKVFLTDEQHEKLTTEYGQQVITDTIAKMDEWCQMKGKSYKDYNLAIRKWIKAETVEKPVGKKSEFNNYDQRNYDYGDLERKLLGEGE